jgi:hypothetical protein
MPIMYIMLSNGVRRTSRAAAIIPSLDSHFPLSPRCVYVLLGPKVSFGPIEGTEGCLRPQPRGAKLVEESPDNLCRQELCGPSMRCTIGVVACVRPAEALAGNDLSPRVVPVAE